MYVGTLYELWEPYRPKFKAPSGGLGGDDVFEYKQSARHDELLTWVLQGHTIHQMGVCPSRSSPSPSPSDDIFHLFHGMQSLSRLVATW